MKIKYLHGMTLKLYQVLLKTITGHILTCQYCEVGYMLEILHMGHSHLGHILQRTCDIP